jgi:glycosyltransferase involved in cell wall biosynthesis
MIIWLVQRAESTPDDDEGKRRLLRVGLLAQILSKRGHEVIWWTSAFDHVGKTHRFKSSVRRRMKAGYHIHYLRTQGYRKNVSLARFIDNITLTRSFERELSTVISEPDIIVSSVPSVELSLVAVQYGAERKIPVVLDIRDMYPDVFLDIVPTVLKPVVASLSIPMRRKLKLLVEQSTSVVGVTDNFVEWGIAQAGRTRAEIDRCFPMAYERPEFLMQRETDNFWVGRPLGESDNRLKVLFLGTLTNSFDFRPVIDAMRLSEELNLLHLTICGVGANESELKELASDVRSIDFAGWVNAAQIHSALNLADIGIAPYIESNNYTNNIPNKPAEYMAGGLGVITSLRSGLLPELLVSTGAGATYQTSHDLLSLLEGLVAEPAKLATMKECATKVFVDRFDSRVVYGGFADYLEEMVARGAHQDDKAG